MIVFLNIVEIQRDVIRKAREYYRESDDIEGTLKQFPRYLVAERAIVSLRLWVMVPNFFPFYFLLGLMLLLLEDKLPT